MPGHCFMCAAERGGWETRLCPATCECRESIGAFGASLKRDVPCIEFSLFLLRISTHGQRVPLHSSRANENVR